jgi:3-hydroxybutyrate dehydrogenase
MNFPAYRAPWGYLGPRARAWPGYRWGGGFGGTAAFEVNDEPTSEAPLKDRVAIITGGAGTMGTATAAALLDAGAKVTIASRDPKRLETTAERLGAPDSPILAVPGDITNPHDVAEVVDRTLADYGRIDVLVNLAGAIAPVGLPAWEIDVTAWRRALEVNLTGAFITTRAVVPIMLEQAEGRLLYLSSTAAEEPFAGASAYGAGKAAVNQLVQTLAKELDGTGVTAVSFNPGPAEGPALREMHAALFPRRAAWPGPYNRRDPSEAAQFILDLCSEPLEARNGKFVSWRDPTGAGSQQPEHDDGESWPPESFALGRN